MKISGPRAVVYWESNCNFARHRPLVKNLVKFVILSIFLNPNTCLTRISLYFIIYL